MDLSSAFRTYPAAAFLTTFVIAYPAAFAFWLLVGVDGNRWLDALWPAISTSFVAAFGTWLRRGRGQ